MGVVNVIMPKLGESIMEATVLKWHKKVGDFVKMDETLLDIATDKVDSEVPSTSEGILEEILCNENDVISIGSVIARIKTSAEEKQVIPSISIQPTEVITPNGNGVSHSEVEDNGTYIPYQPTSHIVAPKQDGARFYSPLVMNIASQEGLPLQELESIPGTGNDGRVTKRDILQYISSRPSHISYSASETRVVANEPSYISQPIPSMVAEPQKPVETYVSGNVEIIEMDRMRKLIAEHMTRSKATSAHVTSFSEADVTNEKREGEKITFTPLFIEAIVKCIKKFPLLNSSVSGDKIIVKKDINIGMATALPSGNLIVPVIKNADQLSLIGVTKQVNRLANTARNGKLHPTETQDGTFTFTNVGTFGSLMGTPIINQPQVAILATGAIKKKPVVVESEKGDSIAIRHMMFISMTYDHRIIDGGMGSSFLGEFVRALESFDINRTY
jgi:2-oxoglutarate dehydrogenase E2 component (dihydrolipoamide succinyltransferase)